MALSDDTSPKMIEVYFNRLAEMTTAERLNLTAGLCEAGHALQIASVKRMFPEADDEELVFRLAELKFGTSMARRVYNRS